MKEVQKTCIDRLENRIGGFQTFSAGAKSPRRNVGSRLSDQAAKPKSNMPFAAPVPTWEDADEAPIRGASSYGCILAKTKVIESVRSSVYE